MGPGLDVCPEPAHDVIISLLCQNYFAMLFWCNHDIIITLLVRRVTCHDFHYDTSWMKKVKISIYSKLNGPYMPSWWNIHLSIKYTWCPYKPYTVMFGRIPYVLEKCMMFLYSTIQLFFMENGSACWCIWMIPIFENNIQIAMFLRMISNW